MAEESKSKSKKSEFPKDRAPQPEGPGAPSVSEGDDGGTSRLQKGIEDAPDKPDPTTIAQVQELHEEEPGD